MSAFGMKTTTGDFLPHVRYDARAGKMFKIEKQPDGRNVPYEIPLGTKFAIDFGSFEAGYMTIGAQGPVRQMQPYINGAVMPPPPQDKDQDGALVFKPGFYTKLAGNALDGVREWCSNAAVVLNAMDELYQTWFSAPEAAQGQIPIISIAGTVPIKSGSGARTSTNYAPIFKIEAWTPRPDVLGPRTVPVPGANGHAHMTTQAAQTMAAASAAPAQAQPAPVQQPVQQSPAQPMQQPMQQPSAAAPGAGMPF
jgi:hypothetical protein